MSRLVKNIPVATRQSLSNNLADLILLSKSDDKMPSSMAKAILNCWQRNLLYSESCLVALLEASFLLEPERTLVILNELQLAEIAETIKTQTKSEEA